MKYKNIREEELKNKVSSDWFKDFDATEILGNIDFTVFPKQDNLFGRTSLLWAEAKTGIFDVSTMFVQLILTIGRARTFDKIPPPAFLGAFDFKKIAFIPFISIQDIFHINDFNWNVTSSNRTTKEFELIKVRIESVLKNDIYTYDYQDDEKELKLFIKNNIAKASESSKIKIDKNNFIPIYLRWLEIIKPIIDVNWEELKKANILDSDFYLADLFVDDKDTYRIDDDFTIRDNLFVIFQNQGYKIAKENIKQMFDATINIKAKDTYQQFWKRYKRPPVKSFQDYIIERRDLLVPQDIRERKGAFFTPRQWVVLSQKYLTDILGQNWQDEYYIWDCAAGTGNLLAGLTNKYNIWASTLDQADVNVMHERIDHGANLLKSHVFQFNFLNDDFSKLPEGLQDVVKDEKKREKLLLYINPPYAEGDNRKGTGRRDIQLSKTHVKYAKQLEDAKREIFVQFLARIYFEIPGSTIAEFSKLKTLTGAHFKTFRKNFRAKLEKCFIVPAWTFDNVVGKFPIGFKIWNTEKKEEFTEIQADVFDAKGNLIGKHGFHSHVDSEYFSKWVNSFKVTNGIYLGWLARVTLNDFQSNNSINILNRKDQLALVRGVEIFSSNLIPSCVCFAVRKSLTATWINDRDQFLYPNKGWEDDLDFQNNCFTFTLFSNDIQSKFGTNHWIPFTEEDVNANEKFDSNFMTNFIAGKTDSEQKVENILFTNLSNVDIKKGRVFSEEATELFDAGRELWRYFHLQRNANVNASLYDIREYFQGRNEKGKMNHKSSDATYTLLIGNLRKKLDILADKISPKVYEYGFLKE